MTTQEDTIDRLVIAAATDEWQKIAVLISKIFEDPALKGIDGLAAQIAERINILSDHGRIDTRGNARRWRDGEVKLLNKK